MTATPDPGVLVVGAGYAGAHALRALRSHGVPTTLVDLDGRHDFVTRLAAVSGGTAPSSDASMPARRWADRVIEGEVVSVGDGEVALADGRRLDAAAVIVTTGSAPRRPPVDGLEHAHTLRSSADAVALRSVLADADAVVVVGGGATGVQLAGSLSSSRHGPLVHLVEVGDRLLAGMPPALGGGAERILCSRGVHVHLGRAVRRITPDGVELDGRDVPGVVVWAGGFAADAAALGLPAAPDGRAIVAADLRVQGMSRTFAAGDVAAHTDADGNVLPMSAQVATAAGDAAGRNAVRVVAGESTRPARLSQIGWVLDLGGRRGLASVGPIDLAAPFLDLVPPFLHDLIDLRELVEVGGPGALRHAPASLCSWLPALVRNPVARLGVGLHHRVTTTGNHTAGASSLHHGQEEAA